VGGGSAEINRRASDASTVRARRRGSWAAVEPQTHNKEVLVRGQ